jgi:hypothetical protein
MVRYNLEICQVEFLFDSHMKLCVLIVISYYAKREEEEEEDEEKQ